ncbi:MAG: Unknown protein [uncultured Campylobacterales bacterium]|uniref:Uncharacterized protein n=1 Tax=uncultured Campylobacterales bacterium TaxID=352960 RepID=A0A6S6S676_9BACT|nr:MAG: Unknown protein [uncultured Campylobacterales bacterium]
MTIVTLTIDDKPDDFMEAFQKFISKFKGVFFEIEEEETEEEVLASFTKAMRDIKSGDLVITAPIKYSNLNGIRVLFLGYHRKNYFLYFNSGVIKMLNLLKTYINN